MDPGRQEGLRTASIGEMRRTLPAEFIEGLYGLFSQAVAERILKGMGERRSTTFRANTLKADGAEILRFLHDGHIKYRRPPWYADAFVLAELGEREVGKWDLYRDGRIYVQGLSSMVPALALAPKPGDRVLDLAAAPGSKTTQMAAMMENRGAILANEPNGVRAERLAYNARLQGCSIVEVHRGWGESLGAGMPEIYQVTSALRHLEWGKRVAVVTDGRFSGVSAGACIGHIGPEALAGGPIGKVLDGDAIRIVVDRDRLEGRVDLVGEAGRPAAGPEEGARILAARPPRPDLAPDPALPADVRLWAVLQDLSGGPWGGCVHDVEALRGRIR